MSLRMPKDADDNAAMRRAILEQCADPEQRAVYLRAAAEDPVFFCDAFCWTFDPRRTPKHLPFVLYPYQEEALQIVMEGIRNPSGDIVVEKTRDMGATWLILLAFFHQWLFSEDSTFLVASRKEELVDRQGDKNCLFWKLDFLYSHLPTWMRPELTRAAMHFGNAQNGSVITGESTNADLSAGGRMNAILLDEFARVLEGERILASTADAAPCRIFVSTPQGMGNAFALVRFSGKAKVITMHWSKHPLKAAGLERLGNGRVTSPWYRQEVARRASKAEIAQELDIDYHGSGAMFFDGDVLGRLRQECFPPLHVGELLFDFLPTPTSDLLRFKDDGFHEDMGQRRMKLWCHLDAFGRPNPEHAYVIGADISTGSSLRSSNSVLSVADVHTGEKVCEFAANDLYPEDFAKYAFAMGRFFGGDGGEALLIWENNGPGMIFGKVLRQLGYGNIWWQKSQTHEHATRSDIPGWHSGRNEKLILLGHYRRALARGEIRNYSREALDECSLYVYDDNGRVRYGGSSTEPGETGEGHGDRVIADALMTYAMRMVPKVPPVPRRVPPTSFMGMKAAWERQERRRSRWEP